MSSERKPLSRTQKQIAIGFAIFVILMCLALYQAVSVDYRLKQEQKKSITAPAATEPGSPTVNPDNSSPN